MIDLQSIQKEQAEWSKKNFGEQYTWEPLLGVVEEVGELAHAHLKEHQNIRLNEQHEENAKDAIGDVVIYMLNYCNLRGFDLEEIIKETWNQVSKRNWTKNFDTGEVTQD